MELLPCIKQHYEDLKKWSSNFHENSLFSEFYFGKVYRGRNEEKVITVKVWEGDLDDGTSMLMEELCLFNGKNFKAYPNAIAFCEDDNLPRAIVYDLDPMDTVRNLIPKDTFSWPDRVKVAIGTASAIRSFEPYILRSIDAAHILCDKDYTPKLYELGMVTGGTVPFRWRYDGETGSIGYKDPYFLATG